MSNKVVIVGAGHAGGRTALLLRSKGFDGEITVLGKENFPPYERPPLSKDILSGEKKPEDCYLLESSQWSEKNICLRLDDPAEDIDLNTNTITTAGKNIFSYDKLVLATGGYCRTANFPGASLKHVFDLRDIPNSQDIHDHLFPKQKVIIVGGGFIGLEVAAAAILRGCEVSIVEMDEKLLSRVFPESISNTIQHIHEAKGVQFYFSDSISEVHGKESVSSVLLRSGKQIDADVVVVGIGLIPDTKIAKDAGLTVDNGIVCNKFCQTSNDNVYAIGDCAKAYNSRYGKHLRLESWQNAEHQAEIVSSHIIGESKEWNSVPWFWTDQYEFNVQLAGDMSLGSELAVRGENSDQGMMFFALAEGQLCGAVSVAPGMKLAKELRVAQMLIEKGAEVTWEELSDSEVRLKSLLKR